MRKVLGTALAIIYLTMQGARSQTPRDFVVDVTASIERAPAQVRLMWPLDENAASYRISRKTPSGSNWISITNLPGRATDYTDDAVETGNSYEYRIQKDSQLGTTCLGYINAGVDAPLVENRGTIILIVDSTHSAALSFELEQLRNDLIGDGWGVIRHDVSPTAPVSDVKSFIQSQYNADRINVKAVFLIGHVPVARSGDINPDGHANHLGAWAADTFYGDMDGIWSDTTVNDTSAERADNFNVSGDGRFDQSEIPSDLELMVGRVDFSDMTCFANKLPPRSEVDLLRQYLNKDHSFRHAQMSVPRRGLIADNFGYINGEAYAISAWQNFAPMFGATNITEAAWGNYFPTLVNQPYLFTYACGGGGYTTCAGVGGSDDFATNAIRGVFGMYFGSYFGDWDNESNFLRASLGSGYALSATWSGRPIYFYHHFALGEVIGYSVRLSQNNGFGGLYEPQYTGSRFVNSALLGDPTLRLHPVMPPSKLIATMGAGLTLSWTASGDTGIRGYNVYRAASINSRFTRLTDAPIVMTNFTDASPQTDCVYMVRAIKLESTPSGTYYNPSQGILITNTFQIAQAPGASCRFIQNDSATQGSWKGLYGSEGYWIAGTTAAMPSYGAVSTISPQWVWETNTPQTVAPFRPADSTRIGACWYSSTTANFAFSFKDTHSHRVSIYFLDFTASGRRQKVDVIDRDTGTILDSRTLTNFSNGTYLTWDLSGDITIRLTSLNINAVANAIFFDSPPAADPTTAARFIQSNTNTQGNWKGIYGSRGYWVASTPAVMPPYGSVSSVSPQWTWEQLTPRPTAPYRPTENTRVAACWYSANQARFDFFITDAQTHPVTIYFLDFTASGRAEQIEVIDRDTGTILDSRTLNSFSTGTYLTWNLSGHITIRLTSLKINAVASAIFFD